MATPSIALPRSLAPRLGGALALGGLVSCGLVMCMRAAAGPSGLIPASWHGMPEWMAGPLPGVGTGLTAGAFSAAMALAQHHLKRMLAFVTISYMGLFLVGIAVLSADGLAGTAVYVVGDGLAKAALFVCVGIIQHRRASIDEVGLHGRCRELRLVGAIFTLGALTVAGLPPFGPFLGKALVEDAAAKVSGLAWIPAAMMVASAL